MIPLMVCEVQLDDLNLGDKSYDLQLSLTNCRLKFDHKDYMTLQTHLVLLLISSDILFVGILISIACFIFARFPVSKKCFLHMSGKIVASSFMIKYDANPNPLNKSLTIIRSIF